MKTQDIKNIATALKGIREAAMKPEVKKALAKSAAASEKGKKAVTLPKAPFKMETKEGLKIADVVKATAMAKKRQAKEREATGKSSVSSTDLAARMPRKEEKDGDGVNIVKDREFKGKPFKKVHAKADEPGSNTRDSLFKKGGQKPAWMDREAKMRKESIEEDMNKVHSVEIDHMGGHDSKAKKLGVTLKKTGSHSAPAGMKGMAPHKVTGKKKDLQKYLAHHHDSEDEAKEHHPQLYKEAMDPVNKAALKGKHKDRKDKDIDNDGDVDSSDKYLHKRRKAVSKAMKGKDADAEVEISEISKNTLGSYIKKAAADKADNAYNLGAKDPLGRKGSWSKSFKRRKGIEKATDKLTKESVHESKSHGNMDNGSPAGEGLSPNGKKMMAMKTDAPEGADITKVAPKTFAAMRASGKKAAMRSGDNATGESKIKPSATSVKEVG